MKGHEGGVLGRWASTKIPVLFGFWLALMAHPCLAAVPSLSNGRSEVSGQIAEPFRAAVQHRRALATAARQPPHASSASASVRPAAAFRPPKLAMPIERPPSLNPALFGVPGGCNGTIYSIVVAPSGLVYMGGDFSVCAQTEAARVVAYEPRTKQFLPLGVDAANGISGDIFGGVYALALDGDNLLVGGGFSQAGGVAVHSLARWDGERWSPIGMAPDDGVLGLVYDIKVVGGSIYVAGLFSSAGGQPASHIARWNGLSWFTYAGGVGGGPDATTYVNAVLVEGNELYVGGVFSQAGNLPANSIARWNGGNWSALGNGADNGVDGVVYELTRFNGELIVAGAFQRAGPLPANSIASWNGSGWGLLGSLEANGMSGAAIAVRVSGSQLFVGGNFGDAAGVPASNIARWDGSRWSGLGEGEGNGVNNTVWSLGGSAQALYAGGQFDLAGGQSANAAALWNGSAWSALEENEGTGLNNQVFALAVVDGELKAGGGFTRAGDRIANRVASWNGSRWASLGEGEANGVSDGVLALASYAGELYAGGAFQQAGGQPVGQIARWNGLRWADVGGSLDQNALVFALTTIDGALYAGGDFRSVGGVSANKIASWNGQQWTALGVGSANGVSIDEFIAVYAIHQHDGAIFVGGSFTEAGGQSAHYIARWDGSSWSPLGSAEVNGTNNPVHALASYQGTLYVGGAFSTAGGTDIEGIARWTGSQFEPVGGGIAGLVLAMVVAGDELYVGGSFSAVDGQPANGLARWNGQRWEGLAVDAPPQIVRALAADGTSLYAGGAGLSQTPLPELLSRGPGGAAADGSSERPVLSGSGRFVAFASAAGNLVGGDDNPGSDIFLRDAATGALERVSLSLLNKGAGAESFSAPAINADGSALAFAGSSGQLYGRFGGLGRVLSQSAGGVPGDGPSASVQLSSSGQTAVFESQASNLLASSDGNGAVSDVFAVDTVGGTVNLVSISPLGQPADGPSYAPSVAADGQTVAFITRAGNLVDDSSARVDKGGRVAQALLSTNAGLGRSGTYLSRNLSTGSLGDGDSRNVRVTPDGRFGVFESDAGNLISGDTNGASDIYWFEIANRQVQRLERVSTSRYGLEGNGPSYNPSVSDDGQYVSFQTEASNLVELDQNGRADIVVKWLVTGELLRLSRTTDGQQPNGDSSTPALSGDGSTVAFASLASNLAAGDNNGLGDVFAARLREAAGPAIVAGASNYSYTWWNPAEPGWGFNLQHQGQLLYGTWYTYAEDGRVMFLTVEAIAQPDGSFSGPIYRVAGTPFQLIDGSSAVTAVNAVGQASMRFAAADQLTLQYTVFGAAQTRSLVPFSFAPNPPVCFSTLDSRAGASNVSDLWWNPAEPGWGLTLAQQGEVIFALWYTYGEAGRDQWLSASALMRQADGSYRGALQRPVIGTPLAAIMGPATSFPVPEVGSAELRFSDGQTGSFSYTLEGVSQSKPIRRFVVVSDEQFKPVCVD